MQGKTALLIFHPGSGQATRLNQAIQLLTEKLCGDNWRLTLQTLPRDPEQLIDDQFRSADMIIAAGGDGTVRCVLEAVARAGLKTPIAIIPVGTGNLLARSLGLVSRTEADRISHAVDTILTGSPMCIDLGMANRQYFVVDAGLGPFAMAIAAPNPSDKRTWKLFCYIKPLLDAIKASPVHVKIITDSGVFERRTRGLLITNAIDMGIGQGIDVHQLCDGMLDICIFTPCTYRDLFDIGWRFANWFLLGRASKHLPYEVLQVRSARIEVVEEIGDAPNRRVPVMLDGDISGYAPVTVEVIPHVVNVIIPKNVHEKTVCRYSESSSIPLTANQQNS